MMKKYIMSLDQGTTSSRCIIFNIDGSVHSVAGKEFKQIFPQPGWVEHNPKEIWESQLQVSLEAMKKGNVRYEDIAGIGITNQRETTIVWDANTGEPLYNAIVWQCRRTSAYISSLCDEGYSDMIRKKTGLVPDAYFSASKIKWILDNVPGSYERAKAGEVLFGTVDTWLLWKLTNKKIHATDYTNASRTMLYNIYEKKWDEDLLKLFGVPEQMLPKVLPSSYIYGETDESILGGRIKIAGIAGDQQASLFGQCCFNKGDVKNTYGTGCFMLMNTGDTPVKSKRGLITTMAASVGDKTEYALEGSVFVAGAGIQWLRDEMEMINDSAKSMECALQVEDNLGVYIVPAFAGMGAPYWNQYARGMAVGITRGTTKNHMIRAVLESMAYQTYDVIKAMEEDSGIDLKSLKVDGGASANDFLMQFQADICDVNIQRPECVETTALGVAYLAGLATGCYKDANDIYRRWKRNKEFKPEMSLDIKDKNLKGWKRAVKCAIYYGGLMEDEECTKDL